MEDLKNLEKIAKENLELAIKEKELAGEFNLTGIKEYTAILKTEVQI